MQIVPLDQVPLEELIAAFNDAFSDYAVTIEMTAEKLTNVIIARSVRLDRSHGVMHEDRLAAFMLTATDAIHLTNVDAGDAHMNAFLQETGLTLTISQFEMVFDWTC